MSWINDVIEVKEEDVGLRLDRFIALYCKKLNFISIQKLLRTGQIRLDGKKVTGAKRILLGNLNKSFYFVGFLILTLSDYMRLLFATVFSK